MTHTVKHDSYPRMILLLILICSIVGIVTLAGTSSVHAAPASASHSSRELVHNVHFKPDSVLQNSGTFSATVNGHTCTVTAYIDVNTSNGDLYGIVEDPTHSPCVDGAYVELFDEDVHGNWYYPTSDVNFTWVSIGPVQTLYYDPYGVYECGEQAYIYTSINHGSYRSLWVACPYPYEFEG